MSIPILIFFCFFFFFLRSLRKENTSFVMTSFSGFGASDCPVSQRHIWQGPQTPNQPSDVKQILDYPQLIGRPVLSVHRPLPVPNRPVGPPGTDKRNHYRSVP
ncbi:uncharacterized protein BO97DRAFT_11068 [Aspergillus homomorphus CBS 101889]|uniref:Secreted protein n=1 Tax=Aspergillus homomorphus (strain CBS 101889) TaxID=1450537 RepID=A0A395IBL1_ASPHC|nr:hypothetical protein BO97DRAFT_11068 [Aspergillus homomorphus CBS 101889]RAL17620.1 hypothetical protein BO97DRAFT_11068 [Aspergillus homomorphus CBS 101889]